MLFRSAVAVSSRATPHPAAAPEPGARLEVRPLMQQFLALFYERRQVRAAFESCVARRGFRDHDPARPGGRQAAIGLLSGKLADPAFEVQVERLEIDGDRATVHARVRDGGDWALRLDTYRVTDGRIVEHWPGRPVAQVESRTTT